MICHINFLNNWSMNWPVKRISCALWLIRPQRPAVVESFYKGLTPSIVNPLYWECICQMIPEQLSDFKAWYYNRVLIRKCHCYFRSVSRTRQRLDRGLIGICRRFQISPSASSGVGPIFLGLVVNFHERRCCQREPWHRRGWRRWRRRPSRWRHQLGLAQIKVNSKLHTALSSSFFFMHYSLDRYYWPPLCDLEWHYHTTAR